jgi:hypothetical protein
MRVLFASPTYGPVDQQCVSAIRAATMYAGNRGIHWSADLSPDRMSYSDARNMVAEWAWANASSIDGVMWVDSDIVPPLDSIYRLLDAARHFDYDILSGLYHQRRPPWEPLIFTFESDRRIFRRAQSFIPDKVFTVDGCGFGFVYTSVKVITAIRSLTDFDAESGQWFPDKRQGDGFGEDLGFCYHALQAGFKVHVDTGNRVGHMGDGEIITSETPALKAVEGGAKYVQAVGT